MGGIKIGGNVQHLPIEGGLADNEKKFMAKDRDYEVAAIFSKDGKPIDAFKGTQHQVNIDPKKLNNPETEGAVFTHTHPNKGFGGTLSLKDLSVFAKSNWGELRAVSGQGQLYSIKALPNADRNKLASWVKSKQNVLVKNFQKSEMRAYRDAMKVLKSGPHKGMVKLTDPSGKSIYRPPMTPAQARTYARQYSVGLFDRTYAKNLKKMGFEYKSTKSKSAFGTPS